MARMQLKITGNALNLSFYSGVNTWAEADMTVRSLDAFDSVANIEIETTPKLFGNGSYKVSERLTEKDHNLILDIRSPSLRTYFDSLAGKATNFETLTFERTIFGVVNSVKTMQANIIAIALEVTGANDDEGIITMTIRNLEA